MITCPICNTQNHHLRVVCTGCGGFVQQRIDTLDLFHTIWRLIESPRKAFHTIAIAQHKNYSLFLAALSGYAFMALIFWMIKAGDFAVNFLQILIAGIFVSPLLGLVIYFLHLLFAKITIRAFGISTKFKNLMAVVSYSLVPLIFSAVFVLPIELATFGIFLFTRSPNPFTLLPYSAFFLFSFDAVLSLWFLIFYVLGIKELLDIKTLTAFLISVISIGITALTISGLLMLFL